MQTEDLKITGMTCGGCARSVTHALQAVDGVDAASVSLEDGSATVRYDEHLTSMPVLRAAVVGAGYGVSGHTMAAKGGCC
jgi:copper chaperone